MKAWYLNPRPAVLLSLAEFIIIGGYRSQPCVGAGAFDGEVHQLRRMEEAFKETMALAFEGDQSDQRLDARFVIMSHKLGRVLFQRHHFVHVPVNEDGRHACLGEHSDTRDWIKFGDACLELGWV